jgi:hypothetical protein
MLFNFALECVITKVQQKQAGLRLNGSHQLLVYADNNNIYYIFLEVGVGLSPLGTSATNWPIVPALDGR